MKVFVHCKEWELSKALRDFTVKQVQQKLGHLSKKINIVRVYLEKISRKNNEVDSASAKYKIELPGKDLVIAAKAHDLYLAIGAAADRAARKLRKVKEKKLTKRQLAL